MSKSEISHDQQLALRIIEQFLLNGGEPSSPAADILLGKHPHLRDFLEQELDKLRLIDAGIGESQSGSEQQAATTAQSSTPRIVIRGYEVRERIGAGGQATVVRAIQESTGQQVAIKTVHGGALLSQGAQERFDREIRILAELNHPYVVSILDRGSTDEGTPFVVMKYVDGEDLDDWLVRRRAANEGRTDAKEIQFVIELFIKICEAVNAAHDHGVTHRDIKPSNIRIDVQEKPRILDFGLARPQDDTRTTECDVTKTGQFVGSLPWASPEQLQGRLREIDARSDVYALGLILYNLLSGQLPYALDGTLSEAVEEIQRRAPTPLSRHLRGQLIASTGGHPAWGPKKLRALDAVVRKAIATEPGNRYATAGALADDLRALLEDRRLVACKDDGRVDRAWLWPAALLAVAIVAVVAVVAAAWFAVRPGVHTMTITGNVWMDTDGDGLRSAGEVGLSNVNVFADLNNDGMINFDDENREPSATTDEHGEYSLSVPSGQAAVRCLSPAMLTCTFPSNGSADGSSLVYWLEDRETLRYVQLVKGSLPDFSRASSIQLSPPDGSQRSEQYSVHYLGGRDLFVRWIGEPYQTNHFACLTKHKSQWHQIDFDVPSNWYIRDTADMNSDGRRDLLMCIKEGTPNEETNWLLVSAMCRADGTFDFGMGHHRRIERSRAFLAFLEDVNADGLPDCIYQTIERGGYFTAEVRVAMGRGDGTFEFDRAKLLFVGPNSHGLEICWPVDIDQDGDRDLFLRADDDTQDVGQCYVAWNQNQKGYEVVESIDAFPEQEDGGQDLERVHVLSMTDVDVDGKLDLVIVCRGGTSGDDLRLYRGIGEGKFDDAFVQLGANGRPDVWTAAAWSTPSAEPEGESAGVHNVTAGTRSVVKGIDFGLYGPASRDVPSK